MYRKAFRAAFMTVVLLSSTAAAYAHPSVPEADIVLTEEQQNELAALYDQAFKTKKEITEKYVEYGVFSEEKGKKILEHMDKHRKMLEKNDFIPKFHHHKKKEE